MWIQIKWDKKTRKCQEANSTQQKGWKSDPNLNWNTVSSRMVLNYRKVRLDIFDIDNRNRNKTTILGQSCQFIICTDFDTW